MMARGAATVGSLNLSRNVTTRAPSAVPETGLPLRLCSVPYPGRGGCFHRDGRMLSKAQGPPLVRKRAALLTAAQDRDDIDIVKIKRLSDGSQLFTFGPYAPEPAPSPTLTQGEQSRPQSSSFAKRSSVPKRPSRAKTAESKPVEEPAPEPSQPRRPSSTFVRRSPIPHSSNRTPASETPVAVSPTVTAAQGAKSKPSAGAPLTGVRERTEAPVPTQDRLRPKSQFLRRSPVAGGRKLRAAVPSSGQKASSDDEPKALSRLPSAFSKKSTILRKPPRKLETEKAEPAVDTGSRSSRPPSSFQKASLVAGRPARKVPESFLSEKELAKGDGAARPKRAATAFKKASPVAGRPARKTPDPASSKKDVTRDVTGDERAAKPKRAATTFKRASPITAKGRGARKPGPRVIQDLTGIVTNGVAKAAVAVERTVEKLVGDVVGSGTGASDLEDEGEWASGESDLHNMKLGELRQLAKERKIKGMWTLKKEELIEALEVSFSEDV
ncbi:hypothetical protein KFL_005420010 [Klebsormidium nitens]|uniref:Rho termination factor-like N-terminal domain-containing protein n=1 Tax=Klebsormidium nitens TaxID=105231 RepID=A0A1Y1IFG2_KLENI|nr:hypothetical protein KFL_005420010 [Klebsormidium nitens]|eukprot:GAQ89610.1 hypothetical protein KFL_005420010 [Klebsormidium nitens]